MTQSKPVPVDDRQQSPTRSAPDTTAGNGSRTDSVTGAPAGRSADVFPLSAAQRGIWFAQHLAGQSPISVAQYVDIVGELDPDLLVDACARAAREFGSGYVRLVEVDGEPGQLVDPALDSPASARDLREAPDPVATAHRLMAEDYSAPLDLLHDRLMTSVVYRVGDDHYLWYQRAHHIVLDGFAAVTMLQRITELYNCAVAGIEAPASTAKDLAALVEQDLAYRDSARFGADRAHWSEHLSDAPPAVGLAGHAGTPTIHPILAGAALPAETVSALDRVVAEHGTGVTPIIVAAFAAYLARMTGSAEVLLSLPVSGRHSAVLRRSGGMVANVVPLRLAAGSHTVGDLIAATQGELTGALRRQRYRQEDIFHDLGIARDETASFGPAVNLMMVDNELVFGATTGRLHVLTSGPTGDLFVNIYPGAGRDSTQIDFQGNPNIYTDAELTGHHTRFLGFLHEFLTAGAQSPVAGLPLLDAAERDALLPVRGPRGVTPRLLPDVLADSAHRYGPGRAVAAPGRAVNYAELDRTSSQMARRLIAQGCGPETAVAIVLQRSVESVTAAWAVAKCGAAIVQVDPQYPAQRIEHILADSGAHAVITVGEYRRMLPPTVPQLVVDDPTTLRDLAALPGAPLRDGERTRPLRPTHIAYTTYTSGSTGIPKGVQVTHAGVANLVADRGETYGIDAASRVSYALSPSFDASFEQFLTCFAAGATLVVVPPEVIGGDELTALLAGERVTHLTLTPAMLATVDPQRLPDLRVGVVGGDVCPPHVIDRWTRKGALYNEYGPTEATITVAGTRLWPDRDRTVGTPIRGVSAMVLDRALQPAPVGRAGELYLAGPGLARGYSHRFTETAARFVADPYGDRGARMYRTGDLARWTEDGAVLTLELLGRSDFQVKIRGYRIEPGEVDAALTGHPDVDFCVTVPVRNPAGATVLASYAVPVDGRQVQPVEMLRFAREALPPHMVPAVVTPLPKLPVNAFGKLDRGALPDPEFGGDAAARVPATEREVLLAGLFTEVLAVARVGADDSFFTLGGDSILSIQLVARAKAVGLGLSTQDVFEHKTVAALAGVATESGGDPLLPELPGGGVGTIPLPPIAHAMVERGHYDRFAQAALIELPDRPDRAGLVRALRAVVDRHDILRAALRGTGTADAYLDIGDPGSVAAAELLTDLVLDRRDATEIDDCLQAAADRLDPARGVVVQAVWMRHRSGPDVMWLVIHHLAVDAVSWRILLADLAQAWTRIQAGDEPHLGSGSTSVRRWVHGLYEQTQARRATELDWWKEVAAADDRLLGARRLDPARDVLATAGRIQVRVPADITEAALTTLPARFHGGANDPLLTALALALREWRRRRGRVADGELIALEGHGREERAVPGADLSTTVGWFTTRFPVRIDLAGVDAEDAFAGGVAAGAAIKLVKEQLRAIPDNGIGYGMLRCGDPVGGIDLAAPPPQVSFNYLGRVGAREQSGPWTPVAEFRSLTATTDPAMALPAVLDVNAIAEPGPDGLELDATFEFASQVLAAEEVDELAGLWVQALRALAAHLDSGSAGGFTPSDFGVAEVSQDDIDRWRHEYPSLSDVWPLTALQSGLLFHARYDRDRDDGYTVQATLALAGPVEADRMRRAAQALVDRHDSLRAAFVDSDRGPRQVVSDRVPVDWRCSDLTDIDGSADRADAVQQLVQEAATGFDPSRPPLLRFHLVRLDAEEYRLVVTNHHIVLDGWSMPLLIHELLTLYAAGNARAELAPPRSYRDYLQWLQTCDRDTALAAWRDTLDGMDGPTRVADGPQRSGTGDSGEVALELSAATTAAIGELGRSHGITAGTSIQVAWALLLGVLTGRADVVFGNTVSHRPPQLLGVEHMVGLFINTLPVRLRLNPRESVAELLIRAQTEQAALLEHRHIGLAELHRATGIADMFDSVTVLESYPLDRDGLARDLDAAGLRLLDIDARDATPYPLSLQVTPPAPNGNEPGTYTVALKFATDRFRPDQVRDLLHRFEFLLTQLVTDPDRTVAALTADHEPEPPAPEPDRPTTADAGHGMPDTDTTLQTILERTAHTYPDAAAVRCGDTVLTYRELALRADSAAYWLAGRGARPETVVAVVVPRSVDLVVALWAVAKTGAAFLPLDPGTPPGRLADLLSEAGCRLGVTVTAAATELPGTLDWLVLDDTQQQPSSPVDVPAVVPRPDNGAYVIYTSGSTGRPKAVHVAHRGLNALVSAQAAAFGAGTGSRVLQVASPGFDAAVSELLLAHSSGACLVVAPPHMYGGSELAQLLREEQVTHAIITPSMLNTMDPAQLPALTTIAVVGEATGSDTVHRWAPDRRLMNHYGPTEATIWATGSPALDPADPPTIGGPIPGVSVAVLDGWLRPVPAGVTGELYLGGPGVARGYVERRGPTASRFIADPRSGRGARIYRTGDAVRWVPGRHGLQLEYLGRNDQQITIHGLRIEPGEIDARLAAHPAVGSAATVARPGPTGEPVLVSYVVPAPHTELDTAALHSELAAAVAVYMNPTAIVALDSMPVTTTGKIDRAALRDRALPATPDHGRAPATPTEQVVATLFAEVLHLDQVSADGNFFALGGDSIVSMRLVALAKSAGLVFTPRDVFERKTVAALAACVDNAPATGPQELPSRQQTGSGGPRRPTRPADFPLVTLTQPDIDRFARQYDDAVADVWPLSPMQAGIHFQSMSRIGSADNYTVQTVIGFRGAVDSARLRRAAQTVVDRHDILRAGFTETAAGPCQIVLGQAQVRFRELDLADSDRTGVDIGDEATAIAAADADTGFDLGAPPLIRFTLIRCAPDRFRLLVTNHHVILDGWSMPLLLRELLEQYGAPDGTSSDAPAPSYRDYLAWLDRQDPVAAETAWARAYADVDAPTRVSRGDGAPGPAGQVTAELPAHRFAVLRAVAADAAVTVNTAVAAAWALTLRTLTGDTDIVFGSAVSGRPPELPLVEQTLGMFLNTIPVRVQLDPTISLRHLLTRIQDQQARMIDHHHIGLLDIQRSAGVTELFDTAIAYQSFPIDRAALHNLVDSAGLHVDELTGADATPFPLSLVVAPGGDETTGLQITLRFLRHEFDTERAQHILDGFTDLLQEIAANPAIALSELAPAGVAETEPPVPVRDRTPPSTLAEILTATAAAHPEAPAVSCGDTTMTYRQLDDRSNRLARLLLRRGGAGTVAVVLPRSPESVIAIWAAAKAGTVFVPIDPSLPPERIAFLLPDSGAALGVTDTATRPQLPGSIEWLVLDDPDTSRIMAATAASPVTDSERRGPIRPQQAAYVIYTSGSTGTPKGVRVGHRGLADLVAAQHRLLDLTPESTVLQVASPSFDAALFELLMAHGSGGRLVVAPPEVYGGRELAALMRGENVSHAVITPSALATVPSDDLPALRVLATAGEPVGGELVARWSPGRTLLNLYGPTECTIWATASAALTPDAPVTIGDSAAVVATAVLDTWLRPVPRGVAGELYLFGPGVADGYLGRTAPTAARFVACPFGSAGARMYRTGDVVRRSAAGALEFVGRNDFQVKVRGIRVEPGEIDTVLAARAEVAFAATVPRSIEGRPVTLVSYVVPTAGIEVSGTELTEAVAAALPAYLVPAAVVLLDEVPLTATGKLNRERLPEPVFATPEFRVPSSRTERIVADAYTQVLGIGRVGADDDFFALGGDSLTASLVVARVGAALEVRVPVRSVFEAPTVGGLAEIVDTLGGSGRIPLTAGARPDPVPLSPAQQRMWFLNRFEPDSAAYNIPVLLRLSGQLDPGSLGAALADVAERHEVLRTIYPDTGGDPRQVVLAEPGVPLVPVQVAPDAVGDTVAGFVHEGFDVTVQPPIRVGLFEITPDHDSHDTEFLLILVVHHIAGDGRSMGPLARDVMAAYAARTAGHAPVWDPLPVQYADYALWQRQLLGDAEDPHSLMSAQLGYWRTTLAGAPDRLELPTDRPRPAVASLAGGRVPLQIGAELHTRLLHLARTHGSSLFMVVHAALAATLARLSGSDEPVIGAPVAGRGAAGLDDLVGMFVNTLALRTPVVADEPYTDLLARVRDIDLDAFEHADVPFERVVEDLNPQRSSAQHPVFQVVLAFQNLQAVEMALPEVTVSQADVDTGLSQFDLQFVLSDSYTADGAAQGISGTVMYARDLFDEATAAGFVQRLTRILEAVTTDPATPVGDIDWFDTAERTTLLSHTGTPAAAPVLLPDVFAAAVHTDPDGYAVVSEDTETTYRQLDERSNRLARYLIGCGAGPETPVLVAAPRSMAAITAWWAVMKTGAAYVPVDPRYPASRITQMVSDSGATLGVTVGAARTGLPGQVDWTVLDDPAAAAQIDAHGTTPVTDSDRHRPLHPQHPAYIVFTSGSTGTPKGVTVTHTGIADFLAAQDDHGVEPASRVLQFASPSFDASLMEILMAVGAAATLVVAPPHLYGGLELTEFLRAHCVTHAFVTPAALASLDPTGLDDLHVVMSGGDVVPPDLIHRWAGTDTAGTRQFRVLYGPTETTIVATAADPTQLGDRPVIGTPLPGMQALVLDPRLRPAPVGVAGELYLAGPALARGYLHRPGTSADRFVACPYRDAGRRMYRTGDLVRWNTRGDLEFIGRNDCQVKVRGFRVEPGEVDAVLAARDEVAFAVTVPHRDRTGSARLISYVVPIAGRSLSTEDLTTALTQTLPSYLVPAAVLTLDEVPVSPNGKLDRRALPAPTLRSTRFRAPASPAEDIVAGVFTDVLDLDRPVGADDDFFELGGNSLAATRVAARVGTALDTRVPVAMIFEAPTVAAFATRAEAQADTGRLALTPQHRPAHVPLSYAQQRMWFLNRVEPDSAAYSIPLVIELSGRLDPDALRAAVHEVVARHEILRTVYPHIGGEPAQVVVPAAEAAPPIPVIPVSEAELPQAVSGLVSTVFDLTTALPLRVRLFALGPDRWVLAVVVHHIAGDGSSLTPLARDMMTAYLAHHQGEVPAWEPLPVQYADYAIWQHTVLGSGDDPGSLLRAQIDYWTTQLADLPARLELPADRPRPPRQSYAGATVPIDIGADLHTELENVALAHNTTLFMVIHAALAATLAQLARTDDIAIGTPYAGRGEPALDDLVGMFVNTLVLRTRTTSGTSFTQLLDQVRDTDLAAFGHADVPFERLVQELNPVRSHAHHPLFQVMLAFQNHTITDLELPDLSVSAVAADTDTSLFDLQITMSDSYDATGAAAGITGAVTYATDLFDPATATAFIDRLHRMIDALATDPAQPFHDIDLLDPTEHDAALARWNNTDQPLTPGDTLPALFAAAARTYPGRIAVTADGRTLTYTQLAAQVNRLARWLIAHGVGPETLVALRMRRGVDQLIALYAVHAAGGGYVPLDPDQPADRTDYMLTVTAPVLMLSGLDDLNLAPYADTPVTDRDRRTPLHPDNTAYVLFTSGSTGRPKGVAVSHRAVVNQLRWLIAHYDLTPADVLLQKTPATFDVSVWELFATTAAGARLVLARPDGHTDPTYLAETIAAEQVTLTSFVPSMLAVFADAAPTGALRSLRALLVAGEAFAADVVDAARRAMPTTALHNLYGPTECTVHATAHPVTPTEDATSVPMGVPVWNTRAYILDTRLHPVPPGVTGDLYLAGDQIARGYQQRPGLTAQRFVPDPYGSGRRLYRTGDLVRRRRAGDLEYLGRTDDQVKLRGLRIELGEIESVLAAHPTVSRAVATVHSRSGGPQLAAYLVPATDATIDTATVLAHAATELPGYMVPAAVTVLDTVPLTASGKLDRARLPEPAAPTRESRAPSSWLEEEVARAFEQVLGVPRVGADDDFYALGGNSLRSVQVVSELKKGLDYEIPISWMLSDPRPADLARRIETGMRAGDERPATAFDVLLPIRTTGTQAPLFCLPPASGLAWCYRAFDEHLTTDRPIYGLQAPQLTGAEPGPAAIEDLAARYVREIRDVQPHGPYHLLGWSLGGQLAHAVATDLESAGEEVALLALLDSEVDGIDPAAVTTVTAGELVAHLGPVLGIDFVGTDATAEEAADLIRQHLGDSFPVDAAMIHRMTDAYNRSIRAAAQWQPQTVSGDLLYFTATRDRRADAAGHRGWEGSVGGRITNVDVDVPHLAMTEPTAVAHISRVLDTGLGR